MNYPVGRKRGASIPNPIRLDGDVVALDLGGGYEALIDATDYSVVSRYRWHRSGRAPLFYATTNSIKGDSVAPGTSLHVFLASNGGRLDVDHKDGDGLNCRRRNLRTATRSQNMANQRKVRGVSRFKGVVWDLQRLCWKAQLKANGRNINIGRFRTEQSAATAYNFVAFETFGDFARLNLP